MKTALPSPMGLRKPSLIGSRTLGASFLPGKEVPRSVFLGLARPSQGLEGGVGWGAASGAQGSSCMEWQRAEGPWEANFEHVSGA